MKDVVKKVLMVDDSNKSAVKTFIAGYMPNASNMLNCLSKHFKFSSLEFGISDVCVFARGVFDDNELKAITTLLDINKIPYTVNEIRPPKKGIKITPFYSENAKEPFRARTRGKATILVRYANNILDILYTDYYEDDWRLLNDINTLLPGNKQHELLMVWRNELRSYKAVMRWYQQHKDNLF